MKDGQDWVRCGDGPGSMNPKRWEMPVNGMVYIGDALKLYEALVDVLVEERFASRPSAPDAEGGAK